MGMVVEIKINKSEWTIHINENSYMRGCNFLANEIWLRGNQVEIAGLLRQYLRVAQQIEYGDGEKPDIEYAIDKITKVIGIQI